MPSKPESRRRNWRANTVFVRWASEGEPVVIYNSTFIPFDTYHFDFATRTWLFHPD